jgi:hypothetical protein
MGLRIRKTTRSRVARFILCGGLLTFIHAAHAALPDEIQVYDDSINKPGERGLELHVNTTPSGRTAPDYPGEIPPAHALRVTPEFSWGLTDTFEAGLYLPTLLERDNRFHLAGVKLRLKWIPKQAPRIGGFFYGANVELAHVSRRFEASRDSLELRPIFGHRDSTWLFAFNPVVGYDLSPGYRRGGFDFSPAFKVARTIAQGIALGIETYSDLGKLSNIAPRSEQQHTLYAAIDIDRGPWAFNFGVGRGLNPATDRWTVKAIFEIPY